MRQYTEQSSKPSSTRSRTRSPLPLNYLLLGLWGLLGAIATALDLPLVKALEQQTQTILIQIRGAVSPPDNIMIVAIDGPSLAAAERYKKDPDKRLVATLLKEWQWQRATYAIVVDRLMQAGARTVALDLLFDLPSGYGAADDQRLKTTLARYPGKVVLAAIYEGASGPQGVSTDLTLPYEAVYSPTTTPVGLANYLLEVDGRVHQQSSHYRQQVVKPLGLKMLPTFAEATLQAAQIPYPAPKGDGIFFYGGDRTFRHIPFWQLLADDWWHNVYLKQGIFKDKIVLIGTTNSSIAADFHNTPVGTLTGVELQANEISSLMQGRSVVELLPAPEWRGLFVLAVVSITGSIIYFSSRRLLHELAWGGSILLILSLTGYTLFTVGQVIVPMAVPLGAIACSGVFYLAIRAFQEQLEKLRLRSTMEQYIAAPVVQEILKNSDSLSGGRRVNAAVLFTDIRGFTTLSYHLPPEQLIEQLNTYFNAMVEVILAAGGTVDKFIGDAIMAEFGFPISRGETEDALSAIRAALGMRQRLVELRQQFAEAGKVPLFNGIGISYGEVIAGDIGSLQRREYGVLGDTVNVASRVESKTKDVGTDILITDALYQRVADRVEVIDKGKHQLKGREENAIQLYALVGWKGDDPSLYERVLEEFQAHIKQSH